MRRCVACIGLVAACSTPSLEYVVGGDAGADGSSDAQAPKDAATEASPVLDASDDAPVQAEASADTGAPDAPPDADVSGPFCPPLPVWATKCEGPVPCIGKSGKACDDNHDPCQACTQLHQLVCCIVGGKATCVSGPSVCQPS